MRKQPTSLDVAKLAGVSQTTVSFVLNNRTDKIISPETRERVIKAAIELKYRSNKLSNGILRGATKLIGVVIPSTADYYFGKVLSGISEQASSNGYQILLSVTSGYIGGSSEEESVTRLVEYRADGIICIAYDWDTDARQEWLDEVISKHIPVVIVDDSTNWQHCDSIVTDDFSGAQLAVEHLISLGHRRIAHFSGNLNQSTGRDRQAGYTNALNMAGILIDHSIIFNCDYLPDNAVKFSKQMLQMDNRPTAVFAAADLLAAPIITELAAHGLRFPQDLSIVGYSDSLIAEGMNLSSIAQSPDVIGRRACDQIFKRISDRSSPPELITLPVKLIKRGSTAKLTH
jgi:LacI family transcriptional regulator